MSDVRITDTDMDGVTVKAGDKIAFSFGIPGRRVEGVLFERDGKLIMPTPDVTPKEATLDQLRYHVGGFWKVGRHSPACECPACNPMREATK